MISEDKVIKLFRIADEFSYDFASGCTINLLLEEKERRQHNSKEQCICRFHTQEARLGQGVHKQSPFPKALRGRGYILSQNSDATYKEGILVKKRLADNGRSRCQSSE